MTTRDRGWRSRWIDIDGPVRYLDFDGPRRAPTIVCVHGLGGSAMNWLSLAPLLTRSYRVLAVDLAGHGLTQSMGRGTDVAANRRLLHRFNAAVLEAPPIVMGNSMGAMIALLEASAAPDSVASLILVDPALPLVPSRPDPAVAAIFAATSVPVLGRMLLNRFGNLAPEATVSAILSLCCADSSRVDPEVIAQHVEVARQRASFPDTGRAMASASRSVIATAGFTGPGLAYRRAVRSIRQPVLVLHGAKDRLVPVSAARSAVRASRSWSLVVLPDAGHVPHLEVPQECASAILGWLGLTGRGNGPMTLRFGTNAGGTPAGAREQ